MRKRRYLTALALAASLLVPASAVILTTSNAWAYGSSSCTITGAGTQPTTSGADPQNYTYNCTGLSSTNELITYYPLGAGLWAKADITAGAGTFGSSFNYTYSAGTAGLQTTGYASYSNIYELNVVTSLPNPPNDTEECNTSTCTWYDASPTATFSGTTTTTTSTTTTTTTTNPTTTTTAPPTTTTTSSAVELISSSGDNFSPGLMALVAGMIALPIVGVIIRKLLRWVKGH